ncbi:MAG: pseudouridine synthase [Bacteroidia bacterium]
MEENLNDSEKRIRKRIVVKRDPSESKPDISRDFIPKPKYPDFPSRDFGNGTYKPYENKGNDFKKPFNPNYSKGNERRPYDPNKSRGDGQKRFNPNFKKDFNKTFVENPLLSHQFFKKHENKEIPIPVSSGKPKADSELIRLNKFISNAGVCSRREADELITKGAIKVNDQVVTELGHKINARDIVEFKGKRITEANHVYILLNKPKDTITTTSDPEKRVTVMDLVQKATDQRIFPIGRLDRNTTGIILLTNDGDFAQKLSHPSSEVKKVYYAILDKPLEREDFEKLAQGVVLDDGPMNVDEIAYVDPNDHSMIGVEIHSGKNRIVHRMFEHLGYRLKKLDRVVYAGLDKGGLRRGKWRFLKFNEIQMVLNTIKYDKSI